MKLLRSAPFKGILFAFTSLLLLITIAGGTVTVLLEAFEFYNYSKDELKETLLSQEIENECYTSFHGAYYHYAVATDRNFRYSVTDQEGMQVAGTGTENTQYTTTYYYYEWVVKESFDYNGEPYSYYDSAFLPEDSYRGMTPVYTVTGGYANDPTPGGDLYWLEQGVEKLYGGRIILPAVTVAAMTLSLTGIILLCFVAGKHPHTEDVKLTGLNKIPLDLFLVLEGGVGVGAVLLGWIVLESERFSLWLLLLPLLGWIASSVLLLFITSLAARFKVGGMLQKTLIGKGVTFLLRTVPTVPTVAVIAGFFALCNMLLGYLTQEPLAFLLLTVEAVVGFFAAITLAIAFKSVEKQAKSLADGNLEQKVDTKFLIGPLKEHGENLNRISDGMNAAVNERIKSERMKTELITNVSHDIKTPLTSIINYVDLLSKENEFNDTAAEYLLVLQRQSARLKKLTDDIVEVSKASSGAIVIQKTPCDLGVLLEQTAAEYQEKTEECNLTVLLTKPEHQITILADGQKLWRVLDNLMNNVCKYALPGTRVYLDLTENGERASITFRNISKDPLNIRPEDLTERFVRGDASRHTEGSGLGLAIAQSLVELQQGTFDLSIDGDLFKVTVTFPLRKE